jgi:hypothetical protein
MTVQVVQMFPPTTLTTSAATLYTVSGSDTAILARGRIRFTNTSASAVTVTAYGVVSGDTAGAGNTFCQTQTVLANGNLDMDIPVILNGGFIQALASTGGVVTAHSLDGVLFS